jgi:hypothetical protein
MARPRNHAKHLHTAVNGLVGAMNGLLDTLGAAAPHLPPELRHPQRAPGKGNRKPRSAASRAAQGAKMRAYWAKRRAAKVGPKPGAKRAPKAAPRKAKGAWASMTPDQRAARIAKMQAGRTSVRAAAPS